jgi:hypothetical protein
MPVYDLQADATEIAQLYGDRSKWETVQREKTIMVATKIASKPTWVNRWEVQSQSDPDKTYVVGQKSDGGWGCACPRWIFNKERPRPDCKHILGVKTNEEVDQAKSFGGVVAKEPVYLKPQPGRKVVPDSAGPVFVRQTKRRIIIVD